MQHMTKPSSYAAHEGLAALSQLFSSATLSIKQLSVALNQSRSTIYEKLNPKSRRYCHDFPKPIQQGRRRMWLTTEVTAYLDLLRAKRDGEIV
jgi:prophage regulatory protein